MIVVEVDMVAEAAVVVGTGILDVAAEAAAFVDHATTGEAVVADVEIAGTAGGMDGMETGPVNHASSYLRGSPFACNPLPKRSKHSWLASGCRAGRLRCLISPKLFSQNATASK